MGKAQSYIREKLPVLGRDKVTGTKLTLIPDPNNCLEDQILGTVYGNCIGDAIGLMTEFLNKEQASKYYSGKHLEYPMKSLTAEMFIHQMVFPEADWTDDSDQMILILQSLMDNGGKAVATDFGRRLIHWSEKGFPELGDTCGMGLGRTTRSVIYNTDFKTDPHKAAEKVWEDSKRYLAPNGGVMRTSIAGVHCFDDIPQVISNTKVFCKVTHADPRCLASCVAVTTAIAMMLQGLHRKPNGRYDVTSLIDAAFDYAKECLLRDDDGNVSPDQIEELRFHMNAELSELKLDGQNQIGYTFKCLGAGFWALRQNNFRNAIEALTLEGGDADTNGAVAGALLGCKLGYKNLPSSWRNELIHKQWLDDILVRYFQMFVKVESSGTPVDAPLDKDSAKESEEGNNLPLTPAETTASKEDQTEHSEESGKDTEIEDDNVIDTSEVKPNIGSSEVTDQAEVKGQSDPSVDVSESTEEETARNLNLEETS